MGDKMRKIISLILLFVAVLAFSGLTMATPVSAYSIKDVGSKLVTSKTSVYGDLQKYHHWYVKYYSKNHVKFYFTTQIREINGYYIDDSNGETFIKTGGWYPLDKITYTCDYKRVSYHLLMVTDKAYTNGVLTWSGSKYIKTSKTAYQRFKLKKRALINNFISIPYENSI